MRFDFEFQSAKLNQVLISITFRYLLLGIFAHKYKKEDVKKVYSEKWMASEGISSCIQACIFNFCKPLWAIILVNSLSRSSQFRICRFLAWFFMVKVALEISQSKLFRDFRMIFAVYDLACETFSSGNENHEDKPRFGRLSTIEKWDVKLKINRNFS